MRCVTGRWCPVLLTALLALLPCVALQAQRDGPQPGTRPGALKLTQPAAAAPDSGFAHQRQVANDVLARPEFQRDFTVSWWEQWKRRLLQWLFRIFAGMNRFGTSRPWVVELLEWTFFASAAAALIAFVLRQMARQRLRVSLSAGGIQAEAWTREASDWAEQAEAFARVQAWRDAVHCLYWAAILLLESRRAWRHNPTRTPREYLRLLQPGSAQQQRLRSLTHLLERVWYGLRPASADDYTEAHSLYQALLRAAASRPPLGAPADALSSAQTEAQ